MQFNIRLKQLRQIIQVTQGELAKIIGVKASTIANYESNRNEPSFDKIIALAKYFNVSVDYLLGITEECHSCVIKSLDNENYELFQLFKQLSFSEVVELKDYIKYLLYKHTLEEIQ
jgi:transcriptional regulator with XRE-family HTH domain